MRQASGQSAVAIIVATTDPAVPFIVAMARSDPNTSIRIFIS